MGMMIALSVAVSLTLVSGAAVAQETSWYDQQRVPLRPLHTPPAMPLTGAAPEVGGPLISQSATGPDMKVAPDGVSPTKSSSCRPMQPQPLHETDGSDYPCIGITEGSAGAKNRH